MNHTCDKHGHYCSICEARKAEEQDDADIQEIIDEWNWNVSVFDIYDQLKDGELGDEDRQSKILHRAWQFFKSEGTRKMLNELHYHMFGCYMSQEKVTTQVDG